MPVDKNLLFEAFQKFGYRPQFFMDARGRSLSPLADISGRFEPALLQAEQAQQQADEAQMESDYLSMKPLEQSMLWRLLEQGSRFRPYDAEALRFYHHKTSKKANAQQAQSALESLRQRTPALVWKSARGEYAVDDATMHRWYERRVQTGTWPPQALQDELLR